MQKKGLCTIYFTRPRNAICTPISSKKSDLLAKPCEFFLFPKQKLVFKGGFHEYVDTIKAAATRQLKTIPVINMGHSFGSLLSRCEKCIDAKGELFE